MPLSMLSRRVSTAHAVRSFAGTPLSEEPGLGALTLPGFLREVTHVSRDREALVLRTARGVSAGPMRELVGARDGGRARAARLGVGKDSRVGVLMTNRPEWIAASSVSASRAVSRSLSARSRPRPSWNTCCRSRRVDPAVRAHGLQEGLCRGPRRVWSLQIDAQRPGTWRVGEFPFLRRLAAVDSAGRPRVRSRAGPSSWRAASEPARAGRGDCRDGAPAIPGCCSSRPARPSQPKGILSSHRGVTIQCWRWPRM